MGASALRSGGEEEGGGMDRGVDQEPFRAGISLEQKQDREMETERGQDKWGRNWGQRAPLDEKLSHSCSSGL